MSDKIIQLNEDLIKHDLKDLVRNSVEETCLVYNKNTQKCRGDSPKLQREIPQ